MCLFACLFVCLAGWLVGCLFEGFRNIGNGEKLGDVRNDRAGVCVCVLFCFLSCTSRVAFMCACPV